MSEAFFEHVQQRLIRLGFKQEYFIGCTDEEIQKIKQAQNVTWLPPLYEEFLLTMGRQAGIFLGSDPGFFYPGLLQNKVSAIASLEEDFDLDFKLPDDAFVFFYLDQGYRCHYFLTSDPSNDPIVYDYLETKSVYRLFDTLSEFYLNEVTRLEDRYGSK